MATRMRSDPSVVITSAWNKSPISSKDAAASPRLRLGAGDSRVQIQHCFIKSVRRPSAQCV